MIGGVEGRKRHHRQGCKVVAWRGSQMRVCYWLLGPPFFRVTSRTLTVLPSHLITFYPAVENLKATLSHDRRPTRSLSGVSCFSCTATEPSGSPFPSLGRWSARDLRPAASPWYRTTRTPGAGQRDRDSLRFARLERMRMLWPPSNCMISSVVHRQFVRCWSSHAADYDG